MGKRWLHFLVLFMSVVSLTGCYSSARPLPARNESSATRAIEPKRRMATRICYTRQRST